MLQNYRSQSLKPPDQLGSASAPFRQGDSTKLQQTRAKGDKGLVLLRLDEGCQNEIVDVS